MKFAFNTKDQRAVAAHLPELRAALADRSGRRDRLDQEIRQLEDLIRVGEGLSRRSIRTRPRRSDQPRRRRAAPAQDRAVEALEKASTALKGTALGPTSLHKYMLEHGMDAPKDATTLGTNLWDAWRAGRVIRATNGVYLPLDGTGRTEVDHPLTDYYYAAEQGLPVPSDPS